MALPPPEVNPPFRSRLLTNRASVRMHLRRQIFPTSEFSALPVNSQLPHFYGNGRYLAGLGSREEKGCEQRNDRNGLPSVRWRPVSHSLRVALCFWLTTEVFEGPHVLSFFTTGRTTKYATAKRRVQAAERSE
jgi:hypothetical protein